MNLSNNKSDITKIRYNDDIVEDPESIANTFNNLFSSIGTNLAEGIPPSAKHFSDYLGTPNPNICFSLL